MARVSVISLIYMARLPLLFCCVVCSTCSLSSASEFKAFDLSAQCPHILTIETLLMKQRSNSSNTTALRVLVPWKVGFQHFVSFNPDSCLLDGFSIQVFLQALRYMQHPPPFQFVLYGSPQNTSFAFDDMLDMLVRKDVDVVVADLTITRERMEKVGFTVPYLASSLVMVTPFRYGSAGTLWDLLKPFSSYLWIVLLSYFVATGFSIFVLEEESTETHLGRIVISTWLFLMLIFNSSYTASLTSILSAQKKYPTTQGFQALLKDVNISVGYQENSSFMKTYIEKLNMQGHKLKGFASSRDYAQALRDHPNGVGAVLDELPYVQILLQSACDLTISSDDDDRLPSFGGFGFAFQKGDPMIDQMSKMILAMARDGTLQILQSGWKIGEDKRSRCNSIKEPSHLESFGGLFSIVASVYIACIIIPALKQFVTRAKPHGAVSQWAGESH